MQLRNLGRSGLRVSVVGLGCNNFGQRIDLDATRRVIDKAIDVGITLFDTADVYGDRGGSETAMGQMLGARRKDIVLATKFGLQMDEDGVLQGGSRRYIMSAVEASLQRLQTDHIDLYQLHRYDPLTPIEETLRALDDLIRAGKVRYIGCSNLPAWRVVEAQLTAKAINIHPFASIQDEYSLLVRDIEAELQPMAQAFNLGILPYFPLASGLLTGKYRRGIEAPAGTRFAQTPRLRERFAGGDNFSVVEALEAFAKARGRTMLELAFSWLASRTQVSSVIAGATKPDQVEQNARATDWAMTAGELAEIAKILAR
jgi:aryl-alcohol dehydrogenase-like predicted oxidoreductase